MLPFYDYFLLFFIVTHSFALHAARIRGEVIHLIKATDVPRFKHNSECQYFSDSLPLLMSINPVAKRLDSVPDSFATDATAPAKRYSIGSFSPT